MEIKGNIKNVKRIPDDESKNFKKTSEKDIVEINKNAKHPFHYIIDGFRYSWKQDLSNNRVNLRCATDRKNCSASIIISANDLKKIENKENGQITYNLSGVHGCKKENINKTDIANTSTTKEEKNTARTIIRNNITKPLNFFLEELNKLKFSLKYYEIKNLVYQEKNAKYPKNDDFLNNIDKITIDLNDDIDNKNLPFCFGYFKYINPNNKYREESFIIFTTVYQLKILRDANIIYIDATFRTAPKGFYQMLNIIADDSNSHINIPVAHIPMTHKTQFLYEHVLNTLLNIASDNGLELSFDSKTIMTDFEKPIRNAIKKISKGVKLKGCFFHFVKALWSKSKKLGLCCKNKIKYTKIIIFCLKMSTLLKREDQIQLFDDIDTFIDNLGENKSYILFKKYFDKNWKNNKFIIFDLINDNQVRSRTNNIAEGFHRKLNQLIEIQNPKCSLVVDVLKNIAIFNFKKSVKNLTVVKNEIEEYPDIWSSCYDYIIRFHKKYHCDLNIKKIIELKENAEFNIDKI